MQRYKPSQTPDPAEWLSLDESLRIELVLKYLEDGGEKIPNNAKTMHALIHVIVENQIASGTEPVPATNAW